jgi:hypothetical protein
MNIQKNEDDSYLKNTFDNIKHISSTEQIVQSEGYCCTCGDRNELIANRNTRDLLWITETKVKKTIDKHLINVRNDLSETNIIRMAIELELKILILELELIEEETP